MKPIIVKRHWWRFWRHPVLPWGWQELKSAHPPGLGKDIVVDGYCRPGDGGGGTWRHIVDGAYYMWECDTLSDAGTFIAPDGVDDYGIWLRARIGVD